MAKRGQRFPYRVTYTTENSVRDGSIPCSSRDGAESYARDLARRVAARGVDAEYRVVRVEDNGSRHIEQTITTAEYMKEES